MGCGSSSTSVQTFKNPEQNKNYGSQKAPSRQSSAASSIRSQSSQNKDETKRKSLSSSSASSSSINSKRQRQTDEESRHNSARPDSLNENTPLVPVASHDENENLENKSETNIVKLENKSDGDVDEKILQAKKHHEEIQKQTFITGDPTDEFHNERVEENNNQSRPESHEEIAKWKEEKRAQFDHEKVEEETISKHGPVPLLFPSEMDVSEDKNAKYTIDDIVGHNNEVADLDWFKYGSRIYSWKKMLPIIQDRVNQFKDIGPLNYYSPTPGSQFGYPIYVARDHGITRKELEKVLSVCRVGICVDVPREQRLARMKQSAENVLEEDTGTEYFKDYKDQLNRWLADYPMNKTHNDPPDAQSDPNELAFPLPADIRSDPSVLRKWIETWTVFDCVVPEEGAWSMKELVKDDWGDTHELFAKIIQEKHGNEAIEPLDMTVDGDVAWVEIELDLFKNDKTTEHQETVWKKRATRTNLNDPVWMKARREELAEILKNRYEQRKKKYPIEKFMNFAEVLEKHWEDFQELCKKEFIPPVRNVRNTAYDKPDIEETGGNEDRLVINHETEDKVSPENNTRLESRNSSYTQDREGIFNNVESEHGDNAEDKLVLIHENREHTEDELNSINANDRAERGPTSEATDSGLDLNSHD